MKVRVLVTSVLLMGMCGAGQSLFAANAAPDEKKQPDAKKKEVGIKLLIEGKEAKTDARTLREVEKKVDQCVTLFERLAVLEHANDAASREAAAKLKDECDTFLNTAFGNVGLSDLATVFIKKFKQPIDLKTPLATYDFSDLNKLPRDSEAWNSAVDRFNAFVEKIREEKIHLEQLLVLIGTFWGPYAFLTLSGLKSGNLLSKCIRCPFYKAAGRIDAALALEQENAYWVLVGCLVRHTLQYDPNI